MKRNGVRRSADSPARGAVSLGSAARVGRAGPPVRRAALLLAVLAVAGVVGCLPAAASGETSARPGEAGERGAVAVAPARLPTPAGAAPEESATGGRPAAGPVAVVYLLSGSASWTPPAERRPREVHLLDFLGPGARLEVAAGSRLALALANGRRYELGGLAQVILDASSGGGIASARGPVRELAAVAPLPLLAALDPAEEAGRSAGAVRIRGTRLSGLYPRAGAAVLAGVAVALRFHPVENAGRYRVEVEDHQGHTLLSTETAAAEVAVPAGTLRPGAVYRWSVRTLDQVGPAATGEESFATLDEESAARRERLRLAAVADPSLLSLLAAVDQRLGLLAEACQELRAALQGAPQPAASMALATLEHKLARGAGTESP